MNQNELWTNIFSAMVNQAIMNQSKHNRPLPQDQREAQEKILNAIHDLCENKGKISPEYRAQVFDAMVLKLASEIGWNYGGAK